eukprot:TRINITY_DN886_c0_g1_i2.p1 TRINITY_DN886_c0_g1~~TRINITY_DN886_c0_g1_i2.p1  ORF type:complete len:115 (-),score=25.04 TRINITY_DN886_c0_g1_i2:180-524(-)
MSLNAIRAFINHPAGPKTIHFWAPSWKWCLVLAGIYDIQKPIEKVSTAQSAALATTGVIWARYSTQIVPINRNLLSVNIFVAITGIYQLYRKARHWYDNKDQKQIKITQTEPII